MPINGEGADFELVRTPDGDREAWLEQRRHGVGGSDVAAIMGFSAFRGPYAVWAEKTGRLVPEDISDKPAVHWGNVLEPIVAGEYRSRHPDRRVRRVNAVCRSISRPWAQASLDFEVHDPELGWGVLEIKTAGLRREGDWEEGVPLYYQTQVAHYLSVTGRKYADVAVLIGGQEYREYRVMRDEEDVSAVEEAVDEFWHSYVEADVEPRITGARDDGAAVLSAHPGGEGEGYSDVTPEMAEFREASRDRARADERYREASNAMKRLIGDRSAIDTPDGRFSWVRAKSDRFDMRRFREERPDVYEAYVVESERDMGIRFKEK